MTKTNARPYLQALSLSGLLLCVFLSVYGYQRGLFSSQAALQAFIGGFGKLGALLFIAFQAVQVVVPILPGAIGCLAGVLLFGAWRGFAFNYIGICIGSLLAFAIARSCGRPILHTLFPEKLIAKYQKWTDGNSPFARWFAIAIFFPVAPDDFLCYLAGTTEMSWRRFTSIILLGKPFAIALYTLFLSAAFQRILSLLG